MITFTAKDLHDKPSPIYQAAVQGPVKITHKFHGDFILTLESDYLIETANTDTEAIMLIEQRGAENREKVHGL